MGVRGRPTGGVVDAVVVVQVHLQSDYQISYQISRIQAIECDVIGFGLML